jgi:hypothetical protein
MKHNHKAVKIDCIDLTLLVDEEELVLAYRMASSNIPCNSMPLNHPGLMTGLLSCRQPDVLRWEIRF